MGSITLLTREGEVEIAKRIEEGDRRVLEVLLNPRSRSGSSAWATSCARRKSASKRSSGTSTTRIPVRRAVARRTCLQGHRQGPPAMESGRGVHEEAGDSGRPPGDAAPQEADWQDRRHAQGVRRARRAGASRDRRPRGQAGPVFEGVPEDAARDPLIALETAGGRQEAGPAPRRDRGVGAGHRHGAEEDQEGRRRGQAGRGCSARSVQPDPATASARRTRPRRS